MRRRLPLYTQPVSLVHCSSRKQVPIFSSQGSLKVVGTPMKFSRTPCRVEKASPELGEHTEEVLSGWADFSKEQIEELRESGVI